MVFLPACQTTWPPETAAKKDSFKMCGIVGLLSYGSGAVDRRVLERMRDVMAHRGPDGGDLWISGDRKVGLAHRRLSIVDLNVSATQPMRNEDGSVAIT